MSVSLDEIVGRASVAGHGDKPTLRYRFLHLQRIGLIGHAVRKASRRGGEGLWHPVQEELFRLYLDQQGNARRATLANAPVAIWLLGHPGIELEHAQRALRYWADKVLGEERTSGRRSLRRRGIEAMVDGLAASAVGRPTRRHLRDVLETTMDRLPDVSEASLRGLRDSLREALPLELATPAYHALRFRLVAVAHLEQIGSADADVAAVWEWCRDCVAAARPTRFDRDQLMNSGCSAALQLWGMAIEGQSGPWHDRGIRRPPPLRRQP